MMSSCSAPARPDQVSAPAATVAVRLPDDGISLNQIGFHNGPINAFSLPKSAVITTSVDQPNGVTLVFGSPSPVALAGYLRRALPETGFVVTQDDPATATLTFTGYGWHGSFTGTGHSSAVILRP
jgi:hypothetical protein